MNDSKITISVTFSPCKQGYTTLELETTLDELVTENANEFFEIVSKLNRMFYKMKGEQV